MRAYVLTIKPEHQDTAKELNAALQAAVKAMEACLDADDLPKAKEARETVFARHGDVWKYLNLRYPELRGMACGLGELENSSDLIVWVHGKRKDMEKHLERGGEPPAGWSQVGRVLKKGVEKGTLDP